MDEYGQCTPEDGPQIRSSLEANGAVVFPLDMGDQATCHIVLITKNFEKIGIIPFGGSPNGRVFVSMWGRNTQHRSGSTQVGCHHFAMKQTDWSYFAEKLALDEVGAQTFAKLWKNMWVKTDEEKFVDNVFKNPKKEFTIPESHHTQCHWKSCPGDCFERYGN